MDTDDRRMEQVREALDRYMEGLNTQQDLAMLKDFFNSSKEIPDDLLPYRELFAVLGKEAAKPSAEALVRLLKSGTERRIRIWHWLAAACAAALAVVLTAPPRQIPDTSATLADDNTGRPAVDSAVMMTEPEAVMAFNDVAADSALKVIPDPAEPSESSEMKLEKPAPRAVRPDIKASVSGTRLASQDEILKPLPTEECRDSTSSDTEEYKPSLPMRLSAEFEQQLASLEQEFQEQEEEYIRLLMDNDKEANLAVKANYISLL